MIRGGVGRAGVLVAGGDCRADRGREDHAREPDDAALRAGCGADNARRRGRHLGAQARAALAAGDGAAGYTWLFGGTIRDNIAYRRPSASRGCTRRSSRLRWRRSSYLRLRSTAGAAAFARQTREEGRLLDGCKWDHQPLAAIKFHIRIRGAPCVGFFSCHVDRSFSRSCAAGMGTAFPLSPEVGLSSIVPSSAGRRNAISGWF
jgi:hypothetical protein